MIKITVIRQDIKIKSIEISGHANYDDYGKDIVCAGVSSIIMGGANALVELSSKDLVNIIMKEGYSLIESLNIEDKEIQTILNVILIQLKSIVESYSKFVRIKELEG